MTYLSPDDWHANHGLAPGDAKLPQPNLAPRPGNLQPTPPIRGYFGPRPPNPPIYMGPGRTVSPFQVTDKMWGVHGLGAVAPQPVVIVHRPGRMLRRVGSKVAADLIAAGILSGLGDDTQTQQILANLQKKVKQEMMAAAAANTAISIGLACIPIVGWAVGLVYSLVTTISEEHYKRAAQQVMADLQNRLTLLAGQYDVKLQGVQDQVFNDQEQQGIALAVSGVPLPAPGTPLNAASAPGTPTNGLGAGHWFDHILNPVKQAQDILKVSALPVHALEQSAARHLPAPAARVLNKVDAATYGMANKAINKGLQVTNALTGEDVLDRTRTAADQAYASASAQMETQYQAAVTNVQSQKYRDALTVIIAQRIRQDPNLANMIQQLLAIQGEAASAVGSDYSKLIKSPTIGQGIGISTILPGVGAAAAVLAIGFMNR